jgi:ketosteroid isomerase-like protein
MAKKKKRSAKKSAAKRPAKKQSRAKGGAKKPAAAGLDALARKIVRMTSLPTFGLAELRELYNEDCTSREASGNVDRGIAELEKKGQWWAQVQTSTDWKATHVWVGPKTICIEWDATVNTRDGRTVKLHEVAVHEIKGGKIQDERFYYDPSALGPPPTA